MLRMSPHHHPGADLNEDADDTMPCPYCGKAIHEESEHCDRCKNYLPEEDQPGRIKPLWLIIAAIVCVLAVLTWILNGLNW
jgi:predicted nucleic acid-binding Zn ribbon protein